MALDAVWLVLTVLAISASLVSLVSLLQGLRLKGSVRRAMRTAFGAFLPAVAIVLPVRGLDEGFDENVRAILSQTYPAYRVLVVSDLGDDAAADRILQLAAERRGVRVNRIVADPGPLPGKVNALRSALSHLRPEDEVVVFADSDIRPSQGWLRQLAQPLADSTVGVATGFRWYIPPRPTFWSLVRSEWNAVSANVLFDRRRTYAWGGSCALRRDDLGTLRLDERWRSVLSDDLILTEAVRATGRQIAYVPTALVPTFEGATRSVCLEWCLRQITMATLYLPIVRRYAAAAFAVFDGSVVLGFMSLALAFAWGAVFAIPAALFLLPLPTAIAKAALRRRAFLSAVPEVAAAWRVPGWRAAIAALSIPWVMAWGLVRTRHPATVRWRGRAYDVRDPRNVRLH